MSLSFEAFAYKKRPSPFVITDSDDDGESNVGSDIKNTITLHDTESELEDGGSEPLNEIVLDDTESENGDQELECLSPTITFKRKRKQVVIESDSEVEEDVIPAPKQKRVCIMDSDSDENEEEEYGNLEQSTLSEGITMDYSKVASFLETCSLDDLMCVPGLSKIRSEKIMAMKPFSDNEKMVEEIDNIKGLSFQCFYENCLEYLSEIEGFERLMEKCIDISNDVQQETLTLTKDSDSLPVQQPSCVPQNLHLKHYQLIGLNWLAMLFEKDMSGILADQMGLGKTIQTLAFIGYLVENGQDGPHLIICPCSTLDNWIREFQKWLPDVTYTVYTGSQENRFHIRQELHENANQSAVILASYNMILSNKKDRAFFKKMKFQYLIMDEAHMVKNIKTDRYKHLIQLDVSHKLLLTGTPLQNDVVELMSLLNFLMPGIFGEHIKVIERLFYKRNLDTEAESSFARTYMNKVKKIMKPFILRRLKADVIADMPPKTEEVCLCPLNSIQRSLYQSTISKFQQDEREGKSVQAAGMTLLMKLRRVTNHPLLVRNHYNYEKMHEMAQKYVLSPFHMDSDVNCVIEDMEVMSDFELHSLCKRESSLRPYQLESALIADSGKIKTLDGLLPKLKEKGHRVLLFSQFTVVLDIFEAFLKMRNYSFVRLDGSTKGYLRQGIIDEYNNNNEVFIFLLSTRAGGLGINLTSADTVILHDIDFNPYNDKQAEDRCHRVGQTRDVTVYKLIGQDTIEENMLRIGEQKLNLEKNLVGNQEETEKHTSDLKEHVLSSLRKSIQNKSEIVVAS